MADFQPFFIGGKMVKLLKIGIIIADIDEYRPFAEKIKKGEYKNYSFLNREGLEFSIENKTNIYTVIAILCGIGKVNATAIATHFVDIGCDYILNYGLSGGVSGISRGEITAPDKFVEHDFDLTGIGYKPFEKPLQNYIYSANEGLLSIAKTVIPNIKFGTAVSGDHFVCDVQKREYLKTEVCAMSCDMETAAIAYVCEFSNTPFLSLRRISDDAGSDATDSYREMNSQDNTLLSDYLMEIINKL